MGALRSAAVEGASVRSSATFLDAARALAAERLAAIAVLDDDDRVVGLFTQDALLGGLFPGYLADLRHTAFLQEDADALAAWAKRASGEGVTEHMRDPLTVDVEASTAHVAERFLHSEEGAIAVVENDRFVGMLDQGEFCRAILARLATDG